MKTPYITTLFLFISQLLFAQTNYTHDSNGNRVKRTGGSALPVSLISFKATKVLGEYEVAKSFLEWRTSAELNSDYFDVQRSGDARDWVSIGVVNARGEAVNETIYLFTDEAPVEGRNFYRLKMIDRDKTFAYSQIRKLEFDVQVMIYPNPVKESFEIKGFPVGRLEMFSVSGTLLHESHTAVSSISMKSFPTGVYILKLTGPDGKIIIKKIVKE